MPLFPAAGRHPFARLAPRRVLCGLAFLLVLWFCPAAWGEPLKVVGSSENTAVVAALAEAFMKANPGLRVEVPESTGSGGGIKAVAAGRAALARVARPLKEHEAADGLVHVTFALSPVVFATHPGVGLTALPLARVAAIYDRRAADWSELGGRPGRIYPLGPEAGDSMHRLLLAAVPGFGASAEPPAATLGSSQELARAAARHAGTIVYLPLPEATAERLEVLSLDGVAPAPENLASGVYPLLLPLGLVSRGEPVGAAKAFRDFVLGPQGARVIRAQGCLPLDGTP